MATSARERADLAFEMLADRAQGDKWLRAEIAAKESTQQVSEGQGARSWYCTCTSILHRERANEPPPAFGPLKRNRLSLRGAELGGLVLLG